MGAFSRPFEISTTRGQDVLLRLLWKSSFGTPPEAVTHSKDEACRPGSSPTIQSHERCVPSHVEPMLTIIAASYATGQPAKALNTSTVHGSERAQKRFSDNACTESRGSRSGQQIFR
jgi:hypothetical protein